MTMNTLMIWEIRTAGSDSNGGGFKFGASGTDRSQQDGSEVTLSASSTVNSTTTIIDVDSGDHVPVAADIGNVLQIHGGTASAGYYEITASGSGQWTLDKSAGTAAQTVVGDMGGAFLTPGIMNDVLESEENHIYVKAGTYTFTTATLGKAGPINIPNSCTMEGYNSTRGDMGTRPRFDAGSQTSIEMVSTTGSNNFSFINFILDGNSGATNTAFDAGSPDIHAINVEAVDCVTGFTNQGHYYNCKATNCSGTGFSGRGSFLCWADGCGIGFSGNIAYYCLASDCTGNGFAAMQGCGNCTADDNGGDGFHVNNDGVLAHCLATNNTVYGYDPGDNDSGQMWNCAAYNNTSGRRDGNSVRMDVSPINLSADPYTDADNDDYSLNNTAGGGASLRAAGFSLPGLSSTDFRDLHALSRNPDAGGGGETSHVFAG